jgi:hypothetical protein
MGVIQINKEGAGLRKLRPELTRTSRHEWRLDLAPWYREHGIPATAHLSIADLVGLWQLLDNEMRTIAEQTKQENRA